MRRSRLRYWSLLTSVLLVAAFFLPFVEVGGLLDDVWDDDSRGAESSADRCQLQRRSLAPLDSPEASSPPDVFAVALGLPELGPRFQSEPGLLILSSPRPPRPSFSPRDLQRGPPEES